MLVCWYASIIKYGHGTSGSDHLASAIPLTSTLPYVSKSTASTNDVFSKTSPTSSLALRAALILSHNFKPGNLVTLDIGPDHHKIVVHEHYLTRTSDFFAAALKKEWIEGQTRIIELREETPETMEFYCDFVYSGQLPTRIFTKRDSVDGMAPAFEFLANLYVLGERRLDTKLRNAAICEMLRFHKLPPTPPVLFGGSPHPSAPSTTSVNTIYQGTPEGSLARRSMVNMVLRFGRAGIRPMSTKRSCSKLWRASSSC